ncbi:MAG: PhzF family phenazine biosynthesis protein [Rufibacter sp.]
MPTPIKTFIIDAFTQKSFSGNPAGVCLLETPLPEAAMQAIAAELNLSETAFLVPDSAAPSTFQIRYFTPTVEIAFCGHATLASAQLVLEKLGQRQVRFITGHGLELHAEKTHDAIQMLFPVYKPVPHPPIPGLAEALGLPAADNLHWSPDIQMLVLEVQDLQTLLAIQPDAARLQATSPTVKGLAVTTAPDNQEYDFYSRCFWPWVGIHEDPVTGSAHSVLGPYWAEKLQKQKLRAFQASARGGSMFLKVTGPTTLAVTAHAKIVLEGTLWLD